MIRITKKEEEMIKIIMEVSNDFDTDDMVKGLSEVIADNFSYFTPEDIEENSDFSMNQISGIMSSLFEKKIISEDYDEEGVYLISNPEALLDYYKNKGV